MKLVSQRRCTQVSAKSFNVYVFSLLAHARAHESALCGFINAWEILETLTECSDMESCDGKDHVVVQLIFVHHGGFVQCYNLSEIYKPVASIPNTSFAQKSYSLVVTLY